MEARVAHRRRHVQVSTHDAVDDGGRILTTNRQEGFHAFYKGITPRIMRVAPGQAVTFTVYEYLKNKLEKSGPLSIKADHYEE